MSPAGVGRPHWRKPAYAVADCLPVMQRTLTPRQTPTGGGEPPGLSPLSLGATPSGSLAGHGGELTTQLQRAQAKAAAWKVGPGA